MSGATHRIDATAPLPEYRTEPVVVAVELSPQVANVLAIDAWLNGTALEEWTRTQVFIAAGCIRRELSKPTKETAQDEEDS